MNENVLRALDGDLPVDQLTPAEAEEYRRAQAAFSAALSPLHTLPDIDVAAAVMQRIAVADQVAAAKPELRQPGLWQRLAGAAAWLWAPRPVALTLRPAFALAATLVVGLALWAAFALSPAAPSDHGVVAGVTEAATAEPGLVLVQFRLGDASARQVALIGDFNAWEPRHQLHEIAPGVWSVVIALEPGVYNYGFVIDGETWRLDPLAPQVADGFGGASSRVAVLAPERRS
jgi:hypothetical protein